MKALTNYRVVGMEVEGADLIRTVLTGRPNPASQPLGSG
jgi:hypothetical protein